jgi:hypothetical protein
MQRSWLWAALLAWGCGQAREAAPTEPAAAAPRPRPTAILHPRPASIPQLGALAERVYIRRSPRADSPEVGILHLGDRADLRATEVTQGPGCDGGWLGVEPEGYVCLDTNVTRRVDTHPLLKALAEYGAEFESATPYRWARSLGAPKYRRLTTRAEQARLEYRLEAHLAALAKLRRGELSRIPRLLREVDASLAQAAPPDFMKTLSPWSAVHAPQDTRPLAGHVPARSSIAFTRQVTLDGRSFLLTNELLLVPKDKVVLHEPSHYAGVHLDGRKQRLPLAFIRREPRAKYRFVEAPIQPASVGSPRQGRFTETGERWPRLGWVG